MLTPINTRSISICEDNFTVKTLEHANEKHMAYQLRHDIFCRELGWVLQAQNGLEIDDYDDRAIFFGVFNRHQKLLAFLRLILPDGSFMMENEFSYLVKENHRIRKENDTAEISRLCVAPEARNDKITTNFDVHNISMFLYKSVYHWCIKNGIRYLYLVVEQKVYRLLHAKAFPCRLIGEPKRMPDGVIAVAAIMDWREFEILNTAKRPEMLKWFTQYRATPSPWQLQQPAPCLQPQASVWY